MWGGVRAHRAVLHCSAHHFRDRLGIVGVGHNLGDGGGNGLGREVALLVRVHVHAAGRDLANVLSRTGADEQVCIFRLIAKEWDRDDWLGRDHTLERTYGRVGGAPEERQARAMRRVG